MQKELNETQKEEVRIIIEHYAKCLEQKKNFSRYDYEREMEGVHRKFRDPQLAELYLKDKVESSDNKDYYLLFMKMYGYMEKYKDF